MTLTAEEQAELTVAKNRLENPSLAAKLADAVGKPAERLIEALPESANEKIMEASRSALLKSLKLVAKTLREPSGTEARVKQHKIAALVSGGVGGALGLTALAAELPISTGIILRSILDIARSEGEDVRSAPTQLAGLTVLALGGRSAADDGAEVGYWATRTVLARSLAEVAEFLAEKGLAGEAAPVLVQLIHKVAARFSVQVSEKFAAQAIPVLGAIGGGALNMIFIDHFQDMARGHFVIRRLERKYGTAIVQSAYENA